MKKFQNVLNVVAQIVKWAGVIMVVVETVEFGYKRLKEKLGEMHTMDVEPEKPSENGA